MEISHLDSNRVIATKFCTWHDSCAVVACTKICCDLMASNGIMARRSLYLIWIAGKKNVSEMGPRTQEVSRSTYATDRQWNFWCDVWVPIVWVTEMSGFEVWLCQKRQPSSIHVEFKITWLHSISQKHEFHQSILIHANSYQAELFQNS